MSTLPPRLRRLTALLPKVEVEAFLVTDETNVKYLSGFTGDSSYLLVTAAGTTILSDGRYETQIAQECEGIASIIRTPSQFLPDLTQSALNDSGLKTIGIESDHLTLSAFEFLSQRCQEMELVPVSGVVESLRMIKDENEIETTRKAVSIAQRAFQSVIPMLTPADTEREIAHELEAKMRCLGAVGCSFAPIVAAGPAGALPHYHPSDSVIGDAGTLLIDWGANYKGYASDLTRTLHRPHATEKFQRAYQAVLDAQLAAIAEIRPGVEASQVDAAARKVLERAGMADAFKHGLGHGTGLQIHESPRMSAISEETLASGMIITVEPGVYFEGEFGIRIEDDVLVTETGHEVLSCLPKGLDDCRLIL
ncbi:MAG: M24 family metallopeptidase [Rubripirellula sp.]